MLVCVCWTGKPVTSWGIFGGGAEETRVCVPKHKQPRVHANHAWLSCRCQQTASVCCVYYASVVLISAHQPSCPNKTIASSISPALHFTRSLVTNARYQNCAWYVASANGTCKISQCHFKVPINLVQEQEGVACHLYSVRFFVTVLQRGINAPGGHFKSFWFEL